MSTLFLESKHYSEETKINNYISSNTKILNTFLELTCPICKDELSDGQTVIFLECSTKHAYHTDCLKDYWSEKQN